MDQQQLTAWMRALRGVPSRREVLRGLVGAGFGLGALRLSDAVEAKTQNKKKKRKKRKKQPEPQPQPLPPLVFNQFGCIAVGQPCRGDSALCCSGICQGAAPATGQPDNSRCIAHDTGTCKQDGEGLCTATSPQTVLCNNSVHCACIQTTAGSNFCYDSQQASNRCAECSKDADCDALGHPSGSACVPVAAGRCAGLCPTGMACLPPCAASPGP